MQDLTKNITDVLNIVNIINDKLSSIDSKKVDKAIMSSFRDSINILLEATKIINDASKLDYFKQLTDEINKINQQKILYETYKQTLTNISKKLVDNIPLTEKENELLTNIPYAPTNIYECLNIVTSSILSIFKSISDLNKIEAVNPVKLLSNLKISAINLNNIIKKIPSIFKNINTDILREIAKDLSTSNINKTTSYRQGDKTIKENEVIDKMSPIDLIKTILNLIGDMSNIKIVNPIKLITAIFSLEKTLNLIIKNIENIYNIFGDFNKRNKNILEYSKKTTESISSLINDITSISENIIKVAKDTPSMILSSLLLRLLIKNIVSLVDDIIKSFNNIEFTKTTKNIQYANNSINFFIDTASNISKLGDIKLIIKLSVASLTIKFIENLLNSLSEIIDITGDKFNNKKIKKSSEKLKTINIYIDSLKDIAENICILGLLAIPATISTFVSIVFILSILPFFKSIQLILNIIDKTPKKNISKSIENLNLLIGTLITTSLSLLATTVIFTMLISNYKILWMGIGTMIAVILLMSGLLWVINTIFKKGSIVKLEKNIFNLNLLIGTLITTSLSLLATTVIFTMLISNYKILWMGIGTMIAVILLMSGLLWVINTIFKKGVASDLIKSIITLNLLILSFVIIASSLLLMQIILNNIIWDNLSINLFKMIGVVIILGLVSFLIGFYTPIFIAMVIGVVVMTVTILSFVIIAGLLIVLQDLNGEIDETKLIGNKKNPGIIQTLMDVMKAIGDIAWETDFLNPLTLIWVTLKFAIMTVAIGLLFLTGGLLLLLQNTFSGNNTLDRAKIEGAISNIFDTVQFILDTLNTRNDSKTDESKRGLLTNIISMVSPGAANLIEAILSFAFVITTLMTVGAIYFIGKLLNNIAELQFKDPTTNLEGIIGAAKRISDLILTPTKSISGEGGKETKFDKFKNWFGNTGVGKLVNGAVEIMSNIGATGVLASILPSIMMLSSVVDLIKSINELTIPKDINTKVTSIIDAAKIISDQVRTDGEVQTIDEDKVKSFGKYVDDSVKYFKNINKLDVSKVKSLGEMYDKMGQFMDKLSDAPINEIADALVNKISPALSDINTNLDKKSKSNTSTQTTTQIPQQTQNTQQNTQQIDYTTILENIEDLLEKIKQKMNENTQLSFS